MAQPEEINPTHIAAAPTGEPPFRECGEITHANRNAMQIVAEEVAHRSADSVMELRNLPRLTGFGSSCSPGVTRSYHAAQHDAKAATARIKYALVAGVIGSHCTRSLMRHRRFVRSPRLISSTRQPLGMLFTLPFPSAVRRLPDGNQILHATEPIRDASRHRRGKATCTVNLDEIVGEIP
jgi:hypothetical protein